MSTTDPREQQQRPSGAPSEPASTASAASTAGASPTTPSANRASSPASSTASTTTPASSAGSTPATMRPRPASAGGGGAALGIAALVLGLLLGAFGMKLVDNGGDGDSGNVLAGNVDEARYQAVILTNDKVYFGRLTEVNDTFFRLDDAFFLRETRESPEAEPVRALLPINRELHAPENSILIRQDEVVLVENLDDESPLLEEIERQTGESGTEAPTSDSSER